MLLAILQPCVYFVGSYLPWHNNISEAILSSVYVYDCSVWSVYLYVCMQVCICVYDTAPQHFGEEGGLV